MKKHYIVLGIFGMCLLLVAGIWGGVVLADRLNQKHEESRAKINTAVAVINQDVGITVDGKSVNYAGAIIETLGTDYSLVSASVAQKGYESGVYGAVVTFPADFSENIVSINEKTPKQAVIQFDINPKLQEDRFVPLYLQLLGVQQQVNNTIAHAYVMTLYEQLHAAQDEVATLLANDEIDMEAVKKVVFNNYMDYLQLGDMPTVPFEPEWTDIPGQMAAAGSVADDVNKVYVDSYKQAQEDFDAVENAISEYGNGLVDQSERWAQDMDQWTNESTAYLDEIKGYEQSLSNWQDSANAFRDNEEEYVGEVRQYVQDANKYFQDQANEINGYHELLSTWCAEVQKTLGGIFKSAEAISTISGQLDDISTDLTKELSDYSEDMNTLLNQALEDYIEVKACFGPLGEYLESTEEVKEFLNQYSNSLESMRNFYAIVTGYWKEVNESGYYDEIESLERYLGAVSDYVEKVKGKSDDIERANQYISEVNDSLSTLSDKSDLLDEWIKYLNDYKAYMNDPSGNMPAWPTAELPQSMSALFGDNPGFSPIDLEFEDELVDFEVIFHEVPKCPRPDDEFMSIDFDEIAIAPALGSTPKMPTKDMIDGLQASIQEASQMKIPGISVTEENIPVLLIALKDEAARLKRIGEETLEITPSDTYNVTALAPLKEDEFELPPELIVKEELELAEAPERPEEIDDSLKRLEEAYAKYNPEDYLNEETAEEALRVLERFSTVLRSAEGAVQASEMGNLTKLNAIYFEYNKYIGELRQSIQENYSKEHEKLKDSLNELGATLENTSADNHALLDSFVSRMPNSRQETTVNQKSVEGTIRPVTYSLNYIRNVQQYDQSEVAMRLLVIMSFLALAIILYIIYLVSLHAKRKKRAMR